MYICIHDNMYICVYVCEYTFTYKHIYMHTCVYFLKIDICLQKCRDINVSAYAYVSACGSVGMYIYICISVQKSIYIYICARVCA